MVEIVELPRKFKRPRRIRGREIWDAPKPSDLMVWEVCPYVKGLPKGLDEGCQQCPEWYEEPNYGPCKRGCRMLAEEACRVVLAAAARDLKEQGKG